MAGTYAVTANAWYWIGIFAEAGGNSIAVVRGTSGDLFYDSTSGFYASPPATVGTGLGVTLGVGLAPISAYFTVQ